MEQSRQSASQCKEVMQIGQIAFNAGLGQILSGQVLLKT
jgi:hypothetical protein